MNAEDQALHEREETNLAAMIGDLAGRLSLTVAAAESLTSGRIAARLGRTRGSSAWFTGAIVADCVAAQRRVLQVRAHALVSEQAAREMAVAGRTLMGADVCVAVTGGDLTVAGRAPGTVCFAVADRDGVLAETRHIPGPAADVAALAAEYALTMVRRRLTAHWQRYRTAS